MAEGIVTAPDRCNNTWPRGCNYDIIMIWTVIVLRIVRISEEYLATD